jgi:acetyl-CoA synthetase
MFSFKDEHIYVAETAVVGYPHEIFGEGIHAYVTLKNDSHVSESDLINQLKALVRSKLASFAIPHKFLVFFFFNTF